MTEESTTHDSIDARPADPDGDGSGQFGQGRLLRGAAAALAGLVGAGAATGSASAASGSQKRLLVFGRDGGRHTYEIAMADDGQISPAAYAGPNDKQRILWGDEGIEGEVWNWNVDSYTYTGDVSYIEAEGQVTFRFPDGAFGYKGMSVVGLEEGRHRYSVGTNNGDIDPHRLIESSDTDEGGPDSEKPGVADYVTGRLRDDGRDHYTVSDALVNQITVENGHIQFGGIAHPF